jgi:hypothetical protein
MTLILSPEQSALYEEGGWPSQRLIETLCEDLERAEITEEVVVQAENGAILFALTGGSRPC